MLTTSASATGGQFDHAILILGALLVLGALVSGIARRSFLSLTVVFVVAGFLLGDGGAGVLDFSARSGFVAQLATVALIVILFRDGLEVESELVQTAWHLPARKLAIAMPVTTCLVALATKALIGDFSWTEAFLVGALLTPTDPVLSSSVVTNPRVPRVIRHSLNLESGLNDGLALPAVLAFAAALRVDSGDFVWWKFVLQDVTLGLLFGLIVGYVASLLMPRAKDSGEGIPAHQRALFALGVAFAAYGVAVVEPAGNGLIATFVAAIVLGIRRPDIAHTFQQQIDELVEVVKLGIFVVFGSLLTLDGLFTDGWAAVAIVALTLLVARPVSVFGALAGTRVDTSTKAFMSWFGPKGVATMTFGLLVLADDIPSNERIFNIAALAVFISILAHGLTDHPGVGWIERRSRADPGRGGGGGGGGGSAGSRAEKPSAYSGE